MRNLASSGSRYFSINGGGTDIVDFNQNPSRDFGDWLSGSCPQANPYVQNAFICADQAADVTATSPEGINLDVIGYDLITTAITTTTAAPPTTTATTALAATTTSTTLLTVLPPTACPNAQAAAAIEAAVEAQCNCLGAANHGAFVRCATRLARAAVKAGTLSKDCKRAVKDCAARSTCGKPGFVTCCFANPGTCTNGLCQDGVTACTTAANCPSVTKCHIKSNAGACSTAGGSPGSGSCCDAMCSASPSGAFLN